MGDLQTMFQGLCVGDGVRILRSDGAERSSEAVESAWESVSESDVEDILPVAQRPNPDVECMEARVLNSSIDSDLESDSE